MLGIVLLVCAVNYYLFLVAIPLVSGIARMLSKCGSAARCPCSRFSFLTSGFSTFPPPPSPPSFQFYVFYRLRNYYLKTAREVKRLEAIARSPVYSHFNASLNGLATLRSHNSVNRFVDIFEGHMDLYGQAYSMFVNTSRWVGFRLDSITFVFATGTIFASLALRDTLGAGDVGLIISYCLQVGRGGGRLPQVQARGRLAAPCVAASHVSTRGSCHAFPPTADKCVSVGRQAECRN